MAQPNRRSSFISDQAGIRLQTIMLLRWLAVAGQLGAVLFVYFGLKFPLPLGFCLAAIAASAWLNVFLGLRYRAPVRLPDSQAAAYLAYDLLQLAALLYLTGGLGNPFSLLFMVPVTISATTLSPRSTGLLLSLAFICVTGLSVYHLPLPWTPDAPLILPWTYQAGIWAGLLLGLGFVAVYAYRIADEARRMSNALEATELVLAREQRLSALDGLAAAAAHELGTPLGTIALVARELQRDKPSGDQLDEDLNLLRSQAERCKEILSRLTHRPDARDALYARIEIDALLSEVVAPHRDMDVSFDLAIDGEEPAPYLVRRPEILYGLGNFVENASDYARRAVTLNGEFDKDMVRISITDDGPGFPMDMVDRLGEPYVTTRPRGTQRSVRDGSHEGMGLGFFIGKTLLERSGATVLFGNRTDGRTGAVVIVEWPRDAIEAPPIGGAQDQISDHELA
ncbi:ActS/PrrB/RegB family redox-sensitive histidine kinase [Parvibaculaceae bacterium PLY_AMNH_Bact1]|nr:ActS/PrrB/RegB family redox-sensitive histidine kinase [Parvibaculaceae bacterium PLY_AMNH_Bact1]